jgi:hypothetical protein
LFSDDEIDAGLGMLDDDNAATRAIELEPVAAAANGGMPPAPGDLTATRVDSLSDVDWDLE